MGCAPRGKRTRRHAARSASACAAHASDCSPGHSPRSGPGTVSTSACPELRAVVTRGVPPPSTPPSPPPAASAASDSRRSSVTSYARTVRPRSGEPSVRSVASTATSTRRSNAKP
eukprot:306516-Chlamydomonas_euryale.AAC.1